MLRRTSARFGQGAVNACSNATKQASSTLTASIRRKATYSNPTPPSVQIPLSEAKIRVNPPAPSTKQPTTKIVPLKPPEGGIEERGSPSMINVSIARAQSKPQIKTPPPPPVQPPPSSQVKPTIPPTVPNPSSTSAPPLTIASPTPIIKPIKKKRSTLFRVLKYSILCSLAYYSIQLYNFATQPGAKRSIAFWRRALPIFADYQRLILQLRVQRRITELLQKHDPARFPVITIPAIPAIPTIPTPIPTSQPEHSGIHNPQTFFKELSVETENNGEAIIEQAVLVDNLDSPSSTTPSPGRSPSPHHKPGSTKSNLGPPDKPPTNPLAFLEPSQDSLDITANAGEDGSLDRFFSDLEQMYLDVVSTSHYVSFKHTLSQIAANPSSVQTAFPTMRSQFTDVFKTLPSLKSIFYFIKRHTIALNNYISAELSASPHFSEIQSAYRQSKDKFTAFVDKQAVGPSIRYLSPHLQQYALPIDPAERQEHRSAQFNVLNEKYALEVYNMIADLRGYYIKVGQVASLRSDFLPPSWLFHLKKFQNECPHTDFNELVPMIESELGPLSNSFESIDHTPLGAASIGQVHKARLKAKIDPETGQILEPARDVVLKLQYPDVEQSFKYDIATIRQFCQLAQPQQVPLLNEVEKAFMGEFDFAREAVHLYYVSNDLTRKFPQELQHYIQIPTPIPELCSKHCLTMTYLPGPRLITHLERSVRKIAAESGKTMEQFMEEYGKRPPPSESDMNRYRQLAKGYDFFWNSVYSIFNYTLGWFCPNFQYIKTTLPIDLRGVFKLVYKAYGHQIFNGHCFSSDCHPGNILWLPDPPYNNTHLDGTIGLIDYGQVKSLDLYSRALFARFLVAMKEQRKEELAMLYFFAGHRTAHNYRQNAVELAILGLDYDNTESRRGLSLERYLHRLNDEDRLTHGVDELLLVGRCTILLRALPQFVNMTFKSSTEWYDIAQDFLQTHPMLDQLITAGLDDFTHIYNEQHAIALKESIKEMGLNGNDDFDINNIEYVVNLDRGLVIQDWCRAVGMKYHNAVYPQLYTSPLPQNLLTLVPSDSPPNQLNQEVIENNLAGSLSTYGAGKLISSDSIQQFTQTLQVDDFLPAQVTQAEVDALVQLSLSNLKVSDPQPSETPPNLLEFVPPHELDHFKPKRLKPEQFWAQRPLCLQRLQQSYQSLIPPHPHQQQRSSV